MAKATSKGFWAWLKVKSNRTVLALIGAGLLAVASWGLNAYLDFEDRTQQRQKSIVSPSDTSKKADHIRAVTNGDDKPNAGAQIQQKAEASDGGVAINAGRDVNINK